MGTACLSRPHLTLTGVGDGDEGGENRRGSFDLAPAGGRHLGFITEPAAAHTTFNLETTGYINYAQSEGLDSAVYPARCDTYLRWLRSAALAFFDAELRDSDAARDYLESTNLVVLSGGVLAWEHR